MMREHAERDASSGIPAKATHIAVTVVEHEERFLVGVRPDGVALSGKHEFPGGKVHQGETAEEAAIRECEEETKLAVEIVGRYSLHLESYDHDTVALHFFAARLTQPADAHRISSPWHWVSRSELSDLDFPAGNRELIGQLTASKPPVALP